MRPWNQSGPARRHHIWRAISLAVWSCCSSFLTGAGGRGVLLLYKNQGLPHGRSGGGGAGGCCVQGLLPHLPVRRCCFRPAGRRRGRQQRGGGDAAIHLGCHGRRVDFEAAATAAAAPQLGGVSCGRRRHRGWTGDRQRWTGDRQRWCRRRRRRHHITHSGCAVEPPSNRAPLLPCNAGSLVQLLLGTGIVKGATQGAQDPPAAVILKVGGWVSRRG